MGYSQEASDPSTGEAYCGDPDSTAFLALVFGAAGGACFSQRCDPAVLAWCNDGRLACLVFFVGRLFVVRPFDWVEGVALRGQCCVS